MTELEPLLPKVSLQGGYTLLQLGQLTKFSETETKTYIPALASPRPLTHPGEPTQVEASRKLDIRRIQQNGTFSSQRKLLPNTTAQPSDCQLPGQRAGAGTETWWNFTLSCAGDTVMTLAIQQFGSSQMLTKMRSTVRWAEPQGQEWFTHPPVRGQAVPGGSDAAWTVLVYRATDSCSRFERLMERFTVEQPSPGDSPELARSPSDRNGATVPRLSVALSP